MLDSLQKPIVISGYRMISMPTGVCILEARRCALLKLKSIQFRSEALRSFGRSFEIAQLQPGERTLKELVTVAHRTIPVYITVVQD